MLLAHFPCGQRVHWTGQTTLCRGNWTCLKGADFVQALVGCRDLTWRRFLGPHVRFDEGPACVVDDGDSRWTRGGIGGQIDAKLKEL